MSACGRICGRGRKGGTAVGGSGWQWVDLKGFGVHTSEVASEHTLAASQVATLSITGVYRCDTKLLTQRCCFILSVTLLSLLPLPSPSPPLGAAQNAADTNGSEQAQLQLPARTKNTPRLLQVCPGDRHAACAAEASTRALPNASARAKLYERKSALFVLQVWQPNYSTQHTLTSHNSTWLHSRSIFSTKFFHSLHSTAAARLNPLSSPTVFQGVTPV